RGELKNQRVSFDVLHVELDVLQAVELVHAEAVGRAHAIGDRVERAEAHRLEAAAVLDQLQLQVPLADHALAFDCECIAEERLRKALAPDLRLDQAPRSLEKAAGGRPPEAHYRTVQAVLQARGEDADHALVPAGNEEGGPILFGKLFYFIERLL